MTLDLHQVSVHYAIVPQAGPDLEFWKQKPH